VKRLLAFFAVAAVGAAVVTAAVVYCWGRAFWREL
jgi:hypothetical protein